MGSKTLLLLSLFLATLLVVSEVAARDLAETSNSEKKTESANGLNDAKYGGGGPGGGYGPGHCRYGCCRRAYYGRGCQYCCRYAGEVAVTEEPQAKPHN